MRDALKVGQRVRLSGYSYGGIDVEGARGVVVGTGGNDDTNVVLDNGANGDNYVLVKPSQCRKLRPRRVAREWWCWLSDQDELTGPSVDQHSINRTYTQLLVREVLPRKGDAK